MSAPVLSIIIPIFNEEAGLPKLIEEVLTHASAAEPSLELILVNDGSRDASESIILAHAARDPRVNLISLSRNFGHHPACQAGMDHCRGQAILMMDGDFQDPPALIPTLLEKWKQGHRVVYTRKRTRDDPALRRLLFGAFYRVFNRFSSFGIEPGVGIFSLLDRQALDVLRGMPERNKYLAGMRQWIGFDAACVEYDRPEREFGEAKQTLTKLVRLALDAIFSFSRLPIRLVWGLGAMGIVLSLVLTAYAVIAKLVLGTALLGWSSVLTTIVFFGSLQLIGIGVLGEYQVRIYEESMRRPYYVVARVQGDLTPR